MKKPLRAQSFKDCSVVTCKTRMLKETQKMEVWFVKPQRESKTLSGLLVWGAGQSIVINETSIIEVKFSGKPFLRSVCRSCGPRGPRLHLKLPAELANA